jgi:hypothetical protein
LDNTIQVVDKFEPQRPIPRGSGKKRKFPEKLGVPKKYRAVKTTIFIKSIIHKIGADKYLKVKKVEYMK